MMIPKNILLPPLSASDRAEFEALCADYKTAKALVSACNNEARITRKKALRAKLKTAPHGKLLSIGAELENLDASFLQAKRGAKIQLKSLGQRYASLFPRLLDGCQSHANELIAKAKDEWAKHFVPFGATPTGESPLVGFLVQWKRSLAATRAQVDLIATASATPNPPASILPYATGGDV